MVNDCVVGYNMGAVQMAKRCTGFKGSNAVEPGYKLTHTRRIQLQQPSQSGACVVAGHGSASLAIKYSVAL